MSTGSGRIVRAVDEQTPVGLHVVDPPSGLDDLERDEVVDHARVGDRREDLLAELHHGVHAAASLRHPVDLGELDLESRCRGDLGEHVGGKDRPLPPDAAQHDRRDAHRPPPKSHAGPEGTIAS